MSPSLRALLTGLIDYAGLFPPAGLPLGEAFGNYARYRQGPDAWMLGRFVCPAARLAELAAYDDQLLTPGPPFAFSALGRGGATAAEFLVGLLSDLEDVATFCERHGGRAQVDVLETRVPPDLAEPPTPSAGGLGQVARVFQAGGKVLFCEAPGQPDGLIGQLGQLRAAGLPVGFKLRCGGTEASAFPSSEQAARALHACVEAGVPLKATAGLHHPFRRFDDEVKATMHGFVNVFAAGVLAFARRPDPATLQAILEDAEASHFTFDEGLRWGGLTASAEEVTAARQRAVLSFGSCSFDEPRDDLRALGWLR